MGTLAAMVKHPAAAAGCAKTATLKVWECACAKCGHQWTTSSHNIPDYCPGCGKDSWWLKRPRGRPPLKLRPDMWVGHGPELAKPTEENTVQFEVTGTPTGETVLLRRVNLGPTWLILRPRRRGRGWEPDGKEHPSLAAAVEILERELEDGRPKR